MVTTHRLRAGRFPSDFAMSVRRFHYFRDRCSREGSRPSQVGHSAPNPSCFRVGRDPPGALDGAPETSVNPWRLSASSFAEPRLTRACFAYNQIQHAVSLTSGCRLPYKLLLYERNRAPGQRCRSEETAFPSHAVRQMSRPDRMISVQEVRRVVLRGEIIEDYPEDARGP